MELDLDLRQQEIWWQVIENSSTIQRLKSFDHGPSHWAKVRANGWHLGRQMPGCDLVVVDLFALFHDAMRDNEFSDPQHGERGWDLFCFLNMDRFTSSSQQAVLKRACIEHGWGTTTRDPTVGVCWDADRLDLPRRNIVPDERRLSTNLARLEATL